MISSDLRKGETPHRTVGHAVGEFARDDDGKEGFFEVPINSPEDFRSEPHPRRGRATEEMPPGLRSFEDRTPNALIPALSRGDGTKGSMV